MKKVPKILLVITLILLIDISFNKVYAASIYKCERGFDLIDDMCKKITNARFRNGYTYCNPGEGTLVGDKCVLEKEPVLVEESDDNYDNNTDYDNNNDNNDNNSDTNEEVETDLVVYPSEYYKCNENGYTLLGNKCIKSTNAYFRNGMYYCNPGTGDLKGKECILTKSAELVCPTGYNKINERCLKYTKNATCKSASASDCWCSEGYVLIGKECYSDLLNLLNPPKTCPSGYELSGYDCIKYAGSAYYRDGNYFCNGANQKLVGQSCYYVYKEETEPDSDINPDDDHKFTDHSNDVSCGSVYNIPKELPKITNIFINFVKIFTPLILIFKGMMDLFKAVTSSKQDEISKAKNKFFKRLIPAIVVFLVVLLTQFIFGIIATNNEASTISECINCFLNNNCSPNINN